MPLRTSDVDRNYIRVSEQQSIAEGLRALRDQAGGDDWHFVVERPDGSLGVLGIDQLKSYLVELGPALFEMRFAQLRARVPAAALAQNTIGIGTAEQRALEDPQGVLFVQQGDELVGRLYRGARRGGDPFPASTMGQLYGSYVDTHRDARAAWTPDGVDPPTCPHCEHVGFCRYRPADGAAYCAHCGATVGGATVGGATMGDRS